MDARVINHGLEIESARTDAFAVVSGDLRPGVLVVCDHASNHVPARYGQLGLPDSAFERHIGYDIGAWGVSCEIAARLGVPAIGSQFSRLLIDPNRGRDDPTLIMQVSDGAIIPGNRHLDEASRRERVDGHYAPYDQAIGALIERYQQAGIVPIILSIHSFTPSWKGVPRPWEVAFLWDDDPRLVKPMISVLEAHGDLCIGENEPYSGQLRGDTMNRHATARGLAHALIEVRQDEIADEAGQQRWGRILAETLEEVLSDSALERELRTARERLEHKGV